jgi:hypothetical protein
MINEKSITACQNSRFGPFFKPLYDSYCFSNIPGTVQSLFGLSHPHPLPVDAHSNEQYDFVICMLLDAFGWKLFERHKDKYPFLQRFIRDGKVSMLTSQFPSTTTPHVTCIHTDLSVGKTGLYEWFCYDPAVDAPIIPLRFSYARDRKANSLLNAGFNAKSLFPFQTVYSKLKQAGIHSYVFQPKEITNSPYSKVMQEGADTVTYKALREGLNKLHKAYSETEAKKAYFFFYYPQIDSYGHEYGPHASQTEKEIEHTFLQLERWFENLGPLKSKTCLMIFADHGMTTIDPTKTIYLNNELPELAELVKKNGKNSPIAPCGSSRDFFLHASTDLIPQLKKLVGDKAEVYATKDLIKEGLFGPVTDRFLERVGDIVLLPYAPYSIWWYEKDVFENDYNGHHGGLTEDELLTPLLFLPLSSKL